MSVEAALYAILQADSGVTDLIGTRLYPNRIPSDASRPCVAYQVISTVLTQTHGNGIVMKRARVQLTLLGTTYASAKSVGAAIQAALHGYKATIGGSVIHHALLVNEYDSFGDSTDLDVVRQDYQMLYT